MSVLLDEVETGVEVHFEGVVHLYPSPEGDVVALRGVYLDVAAGEAVGILGPSGAGKSTVLALLAGEFPASAGTVRVGRFDLGKLSSEQMARLRAREISLVVQGAARNLIPYATAEENVWFAQHGARRRGAELRHRPSELLRRFGLGEVADTPVDELPSGVRQRLALVTGVATSPRLLLVDEPTSQLSVHDRDDVLDTLTRIHAELAMTVVVVSHDLEVAGRFPRAVMIRDGLVGAEGRHGTEYAIVGRDGSVQLPAEVLDLLPPETLVRVVRGAGRVELVPAEAHEEPPDARP